MAFPLSECKKSLAMDVAIHIRRFGAQEGPFPGGRKQGTRVARVRERERKCDFLSSSSPDVYVVEAPYLGGVSVVGCSPGCNLAATGYPRLILVRPRHAVQLGMGGAT